ncbi:hypothetical protein AXF42_Ash003893 [Apostasia shenzhenica]|uniref:ACT domain-containing protein ACR n=1 Tax=Apostasia shenzhenica TaxID=1088818 RepID=A0A2I0AIF7_9ASPA|nr:hypothetical protein AXF42_Ash003893 [Apostasia shenzhenica]
MMSCGSPSIDVEDEYEKLVIRMNPPRSPRFHSWGQSVGIQAGSEHTSIELIGRDRPGLLSEIFAVLTDLKCNIVAAEVWTHNSRMASVLYITDEDTGGLIEDADRLSKIKRLLRYILKGDKGKQGAKTAISMGSVHAERRLHQMMYDDRDYERCDLVGEDGGRDDKIKTFVTVENCIERGYTVVCVRCKDRPKLLFDTVCTLTDMQYVVFHATVVTEEPEAYQEYYIRHTDGYPVSSEGEKQRLIHCLEAAIKRRSSEGLRLELCSEDRIGLLSDVTRIFRENGLSVLRAKVSTIRSQAMNIFYVTDASGSPVQSQTVESVRNMIGETVLFVKDEEFFKSSSQDTARFSLGNLFRSRSEKFLCNLGLIRSNS